MIACSATIDPASTIAPVPPRLFGSFVEHMGRCVYGGVFEPGHPEADSRGLRQDVVALARELGVRVVRYPGGNFVSGYRWEDGVGPTSQRPERRDMAWHSIEPNTFGLDEFMAWMGQLAAEPMLAVNLGTRGAADAVNLLEYANGAPGTRYADMRASNGHREPYGIKLWCLGNEMDGPWQIGHKTADEYGRLAAETARAMRQTDPLVELVACGSSGIGMPTFGSWEATVLDHCYEDVDYVSAHAYFEPAGDDRVGFLACSQTMDKQIDGVVAACDLVAAKKHLSRRLMVSFDEWNVWYQSRFAGVDGIGWNRAPRLIEDEYSADDAVVVGGLLMSLLRHSDRVAIACLAQLVNVIAPIRAEPLVPAWRQTIFHPFALTARHARGQVLRVDPVTPTLDSPTLGDVRAIDVVATLDDEAGEVAVFAVNRSDTEPANVNFRTAEPYGVVDHRVIIGGPSTNPDVVVGGIRPVNGGRFSAVQLPPASWTMLRLRRADPSGSR